MSIGFGYGTAGANFGGQVGRTFGHPRIGGGAADHVGHHADAVLVQREHPVVVGLVGQQSIMGVAGAAEVRLQRDPGVAAVVGDIDAIRAGRTTVGGLAPVQQDLLLLGALIIGLGREAHGLSGRNFNVSLRRGPVGLQRQEEGQRADHGYRRDQWH